MAIPQNRKQFKEFCLRKLGEPVIEINVAPEQVEDRIDEALQFYTEFHFDGVEKTYYKYQLQPADIQNRYIKLPDNIIGAIRMFPIGDPAISSDNLFNIRYQIALNDLYTLTSQSMVPYISVLEHLRLFEELLVGEQPIRFNRKNGLLYLDQDWNSVTVGMYVLIEAYKVVSPEVYPKIWQDMWLQRLATSYIKKQWGENLSKYNGIALIGGIQFNGQQLFAAAMQDIDILEKKISDDLSMPLENFVG